VEQRRVKIPGVLMSSQATDERVAFFFIDLWRLGLGSAGYVTNGNRR
jgi:hypothetical protein